MGDKAKRVISSDIDWGPQHPADRLLGQVLSRILAKPRKVGQRGDPIDSLWGKYCQIRELVYGTDKVAEADLRKWDAVSRAWEKAMLSGGWVNDEEENKQMVQLWRLIQSGHRKVNSNQWRKRGT